MDTINACHFSRLDHAFVDQPADHYGDVWLNYYFGIDYFIMVKTLNNQCFTFKIFDFDYDYSCQIDELHTNSK